MSHQYWLDVPIEPDLEPLEHGSILFVGTATTVIKLGGFTILTDPNFLHSGDHIHVGYGMTSKRITDPAIEIEELPYLDACVLSHMHDDHFDEIAKAKLRKDLPIITTTQAAKLLRIDGFKSTHALRRWDSLTLRKGAAWLRITSMPGKHGPGVMNYLLPPVMGSMLEWGLGNARTLFRLYISGDTLVTDELREIPERFPGIDLALMHLGGTKVMGILVTMDAKQGVEALRIIHPRRAIPIHYNDYPIFKSTLEQFMRAVDEANLDTKIEYLYHGDRYDFTAAALLKAAS